MTTVVPRNGLHHKSVSRANVQGPSINDVRVRKTCDFFYSLPLPCHVTILNSTIVTFWITPSPLSLRRSFMSGPTASELFETFLPEAYLAQRFAIVHPSWTAPFLRDGVLEECAVCDWHGIHR